MSAAMPDTSELFYAHMEADRNEAENAYFAARPGLTRSPEVQKVFRDGFERAYRKLWKPPTFTPVLPQVDINGACMLCGQLHGETGLPCPNTRVTA